MASKYLFYSSSISSISSSLLLADANDSDRARLYSAKSGSPLAVLSYHRSALHAIAFSPLTHSTPTCTKADLLEQEDSDESDDDDEDSESGGVSKKVQRKWMATGGTDARISLWDVY